MESSKDEAAAQPDGADKRAAERHEVELAVSFESEHNFYTGLTQNISSGGLFIATNRLLPIGSRFAVKFTVPGYDKAIEADVEVRWVREMTALQKLEGDQGMGVRFVDLPKEAETAVSAFLRQRESLFYDED